MENLELTGSVVLHCEEGVRTWFIARQGGRYGVVAAGSWEIALPFRFDRIEALSGGGVAAYLRQRKMVYHIASAPDGCKLLPARRELSRRASRLSSQPA